MFHTELIAKHAHNYARVTKVSTSHGDILTPAFMPVGTRAAVNFMNTEQLLAAGSQIILGGNTYHMLLSPGIETLKTIGGMHRFMDWHGPMLTDSGGFQVFSLSHDSKLCRIDEQGAHFKHPTNGRIIHLTPESSIATQKVIGADIIMAFDQCTPDVEDRAVLTTAMSRTHRWLKESLDYHLHSPSAHAGHSQALFGIIQGGYDRALREESTAFVTSMPCDGIAIGGESIGFDMEKTADILSWIRPELPENKIRYTMGVGLLPQNLLDVVAAGVDIFDCVAPTRNARHGSLYTGKIEDDSSGWLQITNPATEEANRLLIKKSRYAQDEQAIQHDCSCYTCQRVSRAYLHYLFKTRAPAYLNYACIHNVHFLHSLCTRMREKIKANNTLIPSH